MPFKTNSAANAGLLTISPYEASTIFAPCLEKRTQPFLAAWVVMCR